jgi:hypothetical protein
VSSKPESIHRRRVDSGRTAPYRPPRRPDPRVSRALVWPGTCSALCAAAADLLTALIRAERTNVIRAIPLCSRSVTVPGGRGAAHGARPGSRRGCEPSRRSVIGLEAPDLPAQGPRSVREPAPHPIRRSGFAGEPGSSDTWWGKRLATSLGLCRPQRGGGPDRLPEALDPALRTAPGVTRRRGGSAMAIRMHNDRTFQEDCYEIQTLFESSCEISPPAESRLYNAAAPQLARGINRYPTGIADHPLPG